MKKIYVLKYSLRDNFSYSKSTYAKNIKGLILGCRTMTSLINAYFDQMNR